jgi:PIN domain nuclease of toxin-antitoxin system
MPKMLDSSALLAFCLGETGAAHVASCLKAGASACTVNLSEAIAVLVRKGMPAEEATRAISRLPLEPVDFDVNLAAIAGEMIAMTKIAGLSLGDRACLAAARHSGDTAVTADRVWQTLAATIGVTVEVIR